MGVGAGMTNDRPTKSVVLGQIVGLCIVAGAAVVAAPSANWDLPLLALLLGFAVFSDLTATKVGTNMMVSGSFLALVMSMVFLGGAPAVLIGVITTVAAWLRWKEPTHYFVHNLLNYALLSLVGGVLFHVLTKSNGVGDDEVSFYVFVFGIFLLSLAINFSTLAIYVRYAEGTAISWQIKRR